MIRKISCVTLLAVLGTQNPLLGHCGCDCCWLAPLTGGIGLMAGAALASAPRRHETIVIEHQEPEYSYKDIRRLRAQIENLSSVVDDLRDELTELNTKLQKKRHTIGCLTKENEKLAQQVSDQKTYIKKLEHALGKDSD